MIIGLLSDTHHDKAKAIPHVIEAFKKKGVEIIIHCGDIEPQHLDHELFGNLPVVCALIEEQANAKEYCFSPPGWRFTKPGDRIVTLPDGLRLYVGHKRAFDLLSGSGSELKKTLDFIRRDNDSVEWIFSGHTHHQIYYEPDSLIRFINPGAVESSFDGYEYAVIDTETKEALFSRIPRVQPARDSFSIGIISDSLNISELDPNFWRDLAGQLRGKNVKKVIHCGNIAVQDIGRQELNDFTVFCYLREDQSSPAVVPHNWEIISYKNPIVDVDGYTFYVKHELDVPIIDQSEFDMNNLSLEKRRDYPEVRYILFGSTNHAFLEEGQQVRILNPGDIVTSRSYVILTLPTTEILFSSILTKPLEN